MTPHDPVARQLERTLNAVCFGLPERTESDVDAHFAPDYEQTVDGETLNRTQVVAHLRHLREHLVGGSIAVQEAVRQGDRVADRHLVRVRRRDGSSSTLEVYLFGELAEDGRLRSVREVTRVIDGADEDGQLGRVR